MKPARRRHHRSSLVAPALLVAAALVVSSGKVARAADGAPPSDDFTHTPSAFDSLVDKGMKHTWREGEPRAFFASTIDVGFLYVRPRVAVGYGKPHRSWFGLEANPTISGPGFGVYSGLRLDLPHFDIRVGGRYFNAFQHTFLEKRPTYQRIQLESAAFAAATPFILETEANADIPLGGGDILLLGSVSYVTNVPTNQNVFEESLRVLVDPPWVVRGRVGYSYHFGPHGQISIGVVGDFIAVPERKTVVVRVGPILRFALSRSVEIRGSFVPRIVSPDDLGLLDSDFTELGLRWRWATD